MMSMFSFLKVNTDFFLLEFVKSEFKVKNDKKISPDFRFSFVYEGSSCVNPILLLILS